MDDFWHAFILHTREYMDFCQRHFGHYFHHEPRDHSRSAEARDGTPGMITKALIEQLFPAHDPEIWARTAICSGGHCDDSTCDS